MKSLGWLSSNNVWLTITGGQYGRVVQGWAWVHSFNRNPLRFSEFK